MSSAEILTLVIAAVACVATALATLAAFRSAKSAEVAQAALLDTGRRDCRRQVTELIAEVEREHRRSKFLAHTIRVIDQTNSALSGNHDRSQSWALQRGVQNLLDEAAQLAKASEQLLGQPHVIANLTLEDATRMQLSQTVDLARLRAINDELNRDSLAREAQLLQSREAFLSRQSQ
jgi:hypothetical protein